MKKLIILAMIFVLMAMASAVLAHPSENSPWVQQANTELVGDPEYCEHPSDPGNFFGGMWYYNTNSGKYHCFKAH